MVAKENPKGRMEKENEARARAKVKRAKAKENSQARVREKDLAKASPKGEVKESQSPLGMTIQGTGNEKATSEGHGVRLDSRPRMVATQEDVFLLPMHVRLLGQYL